MLERVQQLVEDFNEQVNLKQTIYDAVLTTYLEGNYCGLLRNKDENWQIEQLPLTIIEHSGYEENGNPVMLVNIQNLRNALSKTYVKKRDGSFLFFGNINEEVEANFPKEVYDALVNRDTYAVLDQNYTGVCRINNFGRRYGLTPIFRALAPHTDIGRLSECRFKHGSGKKQEDHPSENEEGKPWTQRVIERLLRKWRMRISN